MDVLRYERVAVAWKPGTVPPAGWDRRV